MKFRWSCVVILGVALFGTSTGRSAEPYIPFLQGLRNRGYYDYALDYITQIENDAGLPPDVRKVLPYEKAITLLASSRTLRNPEAQNKQLDQALVFLAQFAKANPGHPLSGQADSERGKILLGKGRVEVWQSKSPDNQNQKAEHQQKARDFIKQARAIFQAAHDKHKTAYGKFDTFIPETEKELYAARAKAEVHYIRAQLDLALCTYERAQTYDATALEYKEILDDASREFSEINKNYRSMVGGLYARLWQGKCFEEQDDLNKALGIYNELLGHPGKSPAMQRLQDQARQFRLICLNHDDRKDYELVIQEANKWLVDRKSKSRTTVGLGIQWELARAQESMGLTRTLPEADRTRYLRLALKTAKNINRYPGQYKEVSTVMVRRLQVAIRGDEGGDPEDFDTAYQLARNLVKSIAGLQEKVQKATDPKEKVKAQQVLKLHLDETARMLRLTLTLVDDSIEVSPVNQTRYLLAYVYYLTRRSYESAILGEFVGRHALKEDSQTASDAAYLAMAAWVQAYNDAPKDRRDVEMNMMARVCSLITSKWPQSDRANDARMTLGRIYSQRNQPAEAAAIYTEIPETSDQFAEAQLAAGQAYWSAYLEVALLPDDQRPSAKVLQEWQEASQKHLRTGIEKEQAKVPEGGSPPDGLIAAKVSLAQILVNNGKEKDAIAELIGGPHPVTKAIAVEESAARPAKGVKSKEFAALVYQLLLRSYVGTRQIDEALEAMNKLEEIGKEDNTAIYVQLGRELEKELKRSQPDRKAEVRKAFEAFLGELFKRRGQTYSSLIWIAETYYSLGVGMGEAKAEAEPYFQKAAETYQSILDLDKEKKPSAEKLIGVRLRLVNCKRRQSDFSGAFDIVEGILKQKPRALDAQFEAADVLQDWGASSESPSPGKLLDAINGVKEAGVWGWGQLAMRLGRAMSGPAPNPDFRKRFLEARYNASWCRWKFALSQAGAKQKKGLEAAQIEIESFALVGGEIDDEWWGKFDSLYQLVQRDLGIAPQKKLQRPKRFVTEPAEKVAKRPDDNDGAASAKISTTSPVVQSQSQQSGSNSMLVLVAVLLAGGGAVGFIFWMGKSKPKRRVMYADDAPVLSLGPKRRPKTKAKAGKPKTVAAKSGGELRTESKAVKKKPLKRKPGEGPPKKKRPSRPKPTE